MQVEHTVAALRRQSKTWQAEGEVVGFVPTMGALHEGHLSLIETAQAQCDRVMVSIFVNPTQFNDKKDLAAYPRTEQEDLAKIKPLGVDLAFLPTPDEMYGAHFSSKVLVDGLTDCLCGATRPGHFDGVATVVTKLLLQSAANKAFFGEKDFQQLQIIRRVVADLNIDCEIVGCPTLRAADGLALSSRNQRLSAEGRQIAPQLHRIMRECVDAARGGKKLEAAAQDARARMAAAGFGQVDYFEFRRAADLSLAANLNAPTRLFAAVFLEGVRLIDNIEA